MPRHSAAEQNTTSLESVAEQLQRVAMEVRAIAEGMKGAGFESLKLTHYDALTQGVKKVLAFSGAAKITLFDEMEKRGDFRSGEKEKNGKPARKPKPKK